MDTFGTRLNWNGLIRACLFVCWKIRACLPACLFVGLEDLAATCSCRSMDE